MENPEKPNMKVTDRRHFTRDGQRRADATPDDDNGRGHTRTQDTRQPAPLGDSAEELSIDFRRLVLSWAAQALVMLGEQPDPLTGEQQVHLEAARETIDILMLLRQKTRGNLSAEESNLLDRMIYELQMKYSQKTAR